jgi:hypothetical protein
MLSLTTLTLNCPQMTNLSPAAQAVLNAYWASPWDPSLQQEDRYAIAAALRAAAERNEYKANLRDEMEVMFSEGWNGLRKEILAIADELEAQ